MHFHERAAEKKRLNGLMLKSPMKVYAAFGELGLTGRLRAAAAFTRPLFPVVGTPRQGQLPPSKSFIQIAPENVQLSAFRKTTGPGFELRVVENQGKDADATVEIAVQLGDAFETDLLGRRVADAARAGGKLSFHLPPWKIRTFRVFS